MALSPNVQQAPDDFGALLNDYGKASHVAAHTLQEVGQMPPRAIYG